MLFGSESESQTRRGDDESGFRLTPFPPESGWKDTESMMAEVFSLLQNDWITDYLLQRDCTDHDLQVIADRTKQGQALSFQFRAASGAKVGEHITRTRHYIPSYQVDGIGAGVTVETRYGSGLTPLMYVHHRYVVDGKQGTQLALGYNEQQKRHEAYYTRRYANGLWKGAYLELDSSIICTVCKTSRIDRRLLGRALSGSAITVLPTSTIHQVFHYPFPVFDYIGEQVFKFTIGLHANDSPVLVFPVVARGKWSVLSRDDTVVKDMVKWDIATLYRRFNPSPWNTHPIQLLLHRTVQVGSSNLVAELSPE